MGRADPEHRVGFFFAHPARWAGLVLLATTGWASAADLPSLTARWEDELATQEWTLAKSGELPAWQPPGLTSTIPLHVILTDAATSERAPMVPSADFRADARRRWGGRTLGVDWVLVLDGVTGDVLTVTGQFKSNRARVLNLEAGWPRHPMFRVEASSDPGVPRLHQAVLDATTNWSGLRYYLGLSAPTDGAVTRTTFRFNLTAQTGTPSAPDETNPPAALAVAPTPSDAEWTAARMAFIRAQARGAGTAAQLPPETLRDHPVFVALPLTNIVVVDTQTSLEVLCHNATATTQVVQIYSRGDAAASQQEVVLHPGESQIALLTIQSETPTSGYQTVTAEAQGQSVLDVRLPFEFLSLEASLARDARVILEVDSTQSGTSLSALNDGATGTATGDTIATWASDETMSTHRVRLTFPQPTAVSEVRLVWPQREGTTYTSTRGRVLGWTDGGAWMDLARFHRLSEDEETTLTFESVRLKAIELQQPPGGGHPKRPNLLWLNELEVR